MSIYSYPVNFQEDEPFAFRNWSYSIIRNKIFQHLKKDGKHVSDSEALLETVEDENAVTPLSSMIRKEGIGKVHKLYMHYLILYLNIYNNFLTPRDRRVLPLVEVDGKLYREASEIIGSHVMLNRLG